LLLLELVGGDQRFGGAEGRVAPDDREVVTAVLEQVGLVVAASPSNAARARGFS
jgi:hypothetical protein